MTSTISVTEVTCGLIVVPHMRVKESQTHISAGPQRNITYLRATQLEQINVFSCNEH